MKGMAWQQTRMGWTVYVPAIVIVFVFCGSAFSQTRCELGRADKAWIQKALSTWKKVRRDVLLQSTEKTPWLLLFDDSCVVHVNPDARILKPTPISKRFKLAGEPVEIFVASHKGKVDLPESGQVPAQLLSFVAPYNSGKSSFLISALPSVWRKAPHLKDEVNLDRLVVAVFVHEMTHTLHRNFYGRLDIAEKRLKGSNEIDDDVIQKKFEKNDDFRLMIEAERELLFRAVSARDRKMQKQLAGSAFEKMQQRRKLFFVGDNAIFAELEDIFLTMEGVANFAAYRAAIEQGLSKSVALNLIRRDGKRWSQDEGMALFLVIDALLPGWQKRAFAERNATALELLAEAVK